MKRKTSFLSSLSNCPICNSVGYRYISFSEGCWGIVERHGFCNRCGYTIEQAYSEPIEGFVLDREKGFKFEGMWYGKNTRKRKRMRRKYGIKHEMPRDLYLMYM